MDPSLLAAMPLFAGVDREALAALLREGPVRELAAGETVLEIGAVADHALLVVRGALAVRLPEGEGSRAVGEIGPGEVAGETALLNPGRRRGASVVAQEATVCLELRPALMLAAAQSPAVVAIEKHLLHSMAQRIRRSNQNIQRALGGGAGSLPERLREAVEADYP